MTAITAPWIRRVGAGVVLVAAPALIALGTATASHADANASDANGTSSRMSPKYGPTSMGPNYGGGCLTPYGTYQHCNAS